MMKERRIAEMRCAFLSAFQPPFPFEEDEKNLQNHISDHV